MDRVETSELVMIVGIIILFCFAFLGIIQGNFDLNEFIGLSSLIVAILVFFYSKAIFGAKISIIKQETGGEFFPTYGHAKVAGEKPHTRTSKDDAFIGGRLRISIIFYNEGDRMSVVTLKKAELPNLNLKPHRIMESFSIPPHTHYVYKFHDTDFKSTNNVIPSKIDYLRIEYNWSKKDHIKKETDKIPIKCQIYSPK